MRRGNAILSGVKAATVSEAELASLGVEPGGQWLFRECVLCNNQVDRDFERFADPLLEDFAKTLPGKSLLVGHRHDGVGEGLWIRGAVFREGERSELRAVFGIPVLDDEANKALRNRVESGIARFVSIGFSAEDLICDVCGQPVLGNTQCPHWPGTRLADGKMVTATWIPPGETMEGSLVYLGAQFGAEVKDPREAFGDKTDALCNIGRQRVKFAAPDGGLMLSYPDLVEAAVKVAGARGDQGLSDEERAQAWLDVQRSYKLLERPAPGWRPGMKFDWSLFSDEERGIWFDREAASEAERLASGLNRLKGALAHRLDLDGPLPAEVGTALAAARDQLQPLLEAAEPQGAKVGRVLSQRNRDLIEQALSAIASTRDALQAVLDAAEPPGEGDDDKSAVPDSAMAPEHPDSPPDEPQTDVPDRGAGPVTSAAETGNDGPDAAKAAEDAQASLLAALAACGAEREAPSLLASLATAGRTERRSE